METKELFEELKSKIILELQEDEIICPTCNGLRMNLVLKENGKGYIEQCRDCHTGKLFICKHCGKPNKSYCSCEGYYNEIRNKNHLKEQELMSKATVIKFSDYKGYLTSPYNEERIVDADDYADEYLDTFDPENSSKFIWASEGEVLFTLNIYDIISEKSEDGYEDMYNHLDTESEYLAEAQVALDEWNKRNMDNLKVYSQSSKILVDVTELYQKGLEFEQNS